MIKAVVFDLGGVLIDDPQFESFWGCSKEATNLRKLFGTGRISRQDFVEKGSDLLRLQPDNFLNQYIESYSQMKRILQTTNVFNRISRPKYLFSDTNPIHIEICNNLFPEIFEKCDKLFLSFQMKTRKNNIKSFKIMLDSLPYKAQELIFIDNNVKYIETAKSLGINAILFNAESDLEKSLLQIDQNILD